MAYERVDVVIPKWLFNKVENQSGKKKLKRYTHLDSIEKEDGKCVVRGKIVDETDKSVLLMVDGISGALGDASYRLPKSQIEVSSIDTDKFSGES